MKSVLSVLAAMAAFTFTSEAALADWVRCATEYQVCSVPNDGNVYQVRFGTGNKWTASKSVASSIRCTVENFGDPAHRAWKVCQYKKIARRPAPRPRPQPLPEQGEWVHCATEYQSCSVPNDGRAYQVRFGVGNRWSATRFVTGSIQCTVGNFGDPAHRAWKVCEYKAKKQGRPLPPRRGGHFGGFRR